MDWHGNAWLALAKSEDEVRMAARGLVEDLDTSTNASKHLRLVANGKTALFFVTDEYTAAWMFRREWLAGRKGSSPYSWWTNRPVTRALPCGLCHSQIGWQWFSYTKTREFAIVGHPA